MNTSNVMVACLNLLVAIINFRLAQRNRKIAARMASFFVDMRGRLYKPEEVQQ